MNPLPQEHAVLVERAIRAAQEAGDLPEFDMPKIVIQPTKKVEHGDYSCPVAMGLSKAARTSPLNVATIIAKYLPAADFVGSAEVAPPGFINFRLSNTWLRDQINVIIQKGADYGKIDLGAGKQAQVEFLSANPTGPITIGRSRGAILGDATARILESAGYEVEREYYFNNAGAQMQNLGESLKVRYLQALGQSVEVGDQEKFYQGEYLIEFAQSLVEEKGDTLVNEDWSTFKEYAEVKMFEWIRGTLESIKIKFDVFFSENSLYDNNAVWDTLEMLDKKGFIYTSAVRESESDEVKEQNKDLAPAKWFRSTQVGDSEDRVVVKSNGDATYTLPDIAYHINKIERGFDLLVNILGADHQTEARVVRYGLEALGYDPDLLHVTFMQMVRAVRDGKEVKMSTRRGVYDTLDELIEMTGADAVRYFLLQRSPDAQLDFDIDLAVKTTNENPVYYIQYAYVRCAGIFREAEARGVTIADADLSLLGEEELRYLRKCLEFSEQLEYAVTNLTPHIMAYYALDLANQFHPMYDKVRVFSDGVSDELAKARLRFYEAVQTVLRNTLNLMGMSTPERM